MSYMETSLILLPLVIACIVVSFFFRSKRNRLSPDDVEWVVNDLAELGVKIGGQVFFLYKGRSLENSGGKYRHVGKREFGETCHPWARIKTLTGAERLVEDYQTLDLNESPLWEKIC